MAKPQEETSLPWVEKYRPKTIDDVFGNASIIATIKHLMESNQLPHLLFYGPPGTGKTSTILACAKAMYGPLMHSMCMELNASDDRGIDVVREQIKSFASTKQIFSSGIKLIILDEADAMTRDAQAALRRIMEKYSKSTRFCLICNRPSKIFPAIQSRCSRFRFAPVCPEDAHSLAEAIAKGENLDISEDGFKSLEKVCGGDLRKMVNVMQATALSYGKITQETVYRSTAYPEPEVIRSLLTTLLSSPLEMGINAIGTMLEGGVSFGDIISELMEYVLRLKDFPPLAKARLLSRMAAAERRVASGCNALLARAALAAAFAAARHDTQHNAHS